MSEKFNDKSNDDKIEDGNQTFKRYLTNCLMNQYGFTQVDADAAIKNSVINKLLKDDYELVMHDSIECWAEILNKEVEYNMKNNIIMDPFYNPANIKHLKESIEQLNQGNCCKEHDIIEADNE